jgi:hypothetical protein
MANNIYLTQETQRSSQGQMETQGSSEMSVMETQGSSQISTSVMEIQGPSQCVPSSSASVPQGINELDRREEEMQEDNEGGL